MHTAHTCEGELANFFVGFHGICCHTVQTVFCKRCCGRKQLWPTFSHGYMTTSRTISCYGERQTMVSPLALLFFLYNMKFLFPVSHFLQCLHQWQFQVRRQRWLGMKLIQCGKLSHNYLVKLHAFYCFYTKHVCLAVTSHLHVWQNDRDLLRVTAVTRLWNGYRNQSQHRELSVEKKFFSPAAPAGNRTRDLAHKGGREPKTKKKEKTRVW